MSDVTAIALSIVLPLSLWHWLAVKWNPTPPKTALAQIGAAYAAALGSTVVIMQTATQAFVDFEQSLSAVAVTLAERNDNDRA